MKKMMNLWKNEGRNRFCGFTLVEILIVVVILAIASMLAIPMFTNAAGTQLKSAANMIAADLEYARSMAISTQQKYSVVFSSADESYEVQDSAGTVIANPINPGALLSVVFPNVSSLEDVVVTSVIFTDGADTYESVTFDYLGSPYIGLTTTIHLSSGAIVLQADSAGPMTINIEPVTGYITIQ